MKKLIVPEGQASFISTRGGRLTGKSADIGLSRPEVVRAGWPDLIEVMGKTYGRRIPLTDNGREVVSYRASDGSLLELWVD